MTDAQQRSVIRALRLGAAVSALIFAAWVFGTSLHMIAPTYRLGMSLIGQGPSPAAAAAALHAPSAQLASWLARSHTNWSVSTSQSPAISRDGAPTRAWIAIAHFSSRSTNLAALTDALRTVERRSAWPVVNIDTGGEFTPVVVRRGVTQLRLSELVDRPGPGTYVRLQTTGPSVVFSLPDVLPIALIALLVIGFGATERNAADVFAFPRGMHPAIVFNQLLVLALFCCFLVSYSRVRASHFSLGLLVLDAAVGGCIARWLWISAPNWRRTTTTVVARRLIIGATTCVIAAALLIAGNVV